MLLKYNTEKLKKVVEHFFNISGVSASILDSDGNHLAGCPLSTNQFCGYIHTSPEGTKRCQKSDRTLLDEVIKSKCAVTRCCHAGLMDTVVPIYSHDVLLGFIIFGQIGDGEMTKVPFSEIYERTKDLGLDRDRLEDAYNKFIFTDRKKLESATEIITILTKYILLERLIEPEYEDQLEKIIKHIDENIADDLSVGVLCRKFNISKNSLYDLFRSHLGCSVKEYVNSKRIGYAEELLKTTNDTVYEISEKVGIRNNQYFCRLFKEAKGDTPLQYRKKWKTQQSHIGFSKE